METFSKFVEESDSIPRKAIKLAIAILLEYNYTGVSYPMNDIPTLEWEWNDGSHNGKARPFKFEEVPHTSIQFEGKKTFSEIFTGNGLQDFKRKHLPLVIQFFVPFNK